MTGVGGASKGQCVGLSPLTILIFPFWRLALCARSCHVLTQTIAIKLCSHHYSDWCDIVYDNVWFTAALESCTQMAAFVACLGIYLV
jgi:hypothetical protein